MMKFVAYNVTHHSSLALLISAIDIMHLLQLKFTLIYYLKTKRFTALPQQNKFVCLRFLIKEVNNWLTSYVISYHMQ
jgi:predicted DNA-binding transcriptional regulator AlpA